MKVILLLLAALFPVSVAAQTLCPPTPAYTPCDVVFELSGEEMQANPNPYVSVTLDVEFRSPHFRTFRVPAFWDGANRIVARFAPTEAGGWDFRVSSNLSRLDGKTGRVEAVASDSPGFVRPRNVHHWGYSENDQPHLWMGDTSLRFPFLAQDEFDRLVAARSRQKFNHIRGLAIGGEADSAKAYPSDRKPAPEFFQGLDRRILAMNKAGIVADLMLAGGRDHLVKLFPEARDRERYVRYLVGRYAAMHVTWQGVEEFESYENGRALLKEIGALLKKLDPYDHPRSTGAAFTSSPLFEDGWMTYIVENSTDNQLGAIEHQIYAVPFVNVAVGLPLPGAAGADALRKQAWNAAMNGQYPTCAADAAETLNSPGAASMTAWFDFFSGTRHWELEPYFDIDGGRALALELSRDEEMEGIEYIAYLEKAKSVEIVLQSQRYDIAWVNPVTGERRKQKQFRGDRLRMDPPDTKQDWVLHVSRDSKKDGMLRSYKFESRRPLMQEVEQNADRIPYEIVEPAAGTLLTGLPLKYAAKVTRDTRATRSMMWLWTAEVSTDGQGFRVLGTGTEGEMRVPPGIVRRNPAVLNLRLTGMNANGKVYFVDRIYRLGQ
jgi:hypothetical protein